MKKTFYTTLFSIGAVLLLLASCNVEEEAVETKKLENTIQSVSYFADTLGVDPEIILESFEKMNQAINEIGYPDAGYKIWLKNNDDSEIKYMIEGYWPDQDTYILIHEHKLYNDTYELIKDNMTGLVSVEYHRFTAME